MGLILWAAAGQLAAVGQVSLTGPIQFTGPDSTRTIVGLAWPARADAAVTVEAALVSGGFTWTSAQLSVDTIELSPDPAVLTVRDGLLLRFAAPSERDGRLFVRPGPGHAALPLLRPDGLRPVRGQLTAGRIIEVMKADGRFVLLNAPERGCPAGSLAAHERLCMDVTPVPSTLFHDAVRICGERGGKLCAWDEYIAACTLLQSQLNGLFVDWEWIDESSNHTHGADQAGRFTCASQRNQGVLDERLGGVRCCYRPH
ncbi:MAG: hypothetical protein MUE88_02300 [Flavobacteriales bacterium]|nr:hypothetical protein [Flavobacteriales bacterium]